MKTLTQIKIEPGQVWERPSGEQFEVFKVGLIRTEMRYIGGGANKLTRSTVSFSAFDFENCELKGQRRG